MLRMGVVAAISGISLPRSFVSKRAPVANRICLTLSLCLFTLATFSLLRVQLTLAQPPLNPTEWATACSNLNETVINPPYGLTCCPNGWEYLRDTNQCANPADSSCSDGCELYDPYTPHQCIGYSRCCGFGYATGCVLDVNFGFGCWAQNHDWWYDTCASRIFPNGVQNATDSHCQLNDPATCSGAPCTIDRVTGVATCDCPLGWASDRCEQFIGIPGYYSSIIPLNGSSINISFVPCPSGYFCPPNSTSPEICPRGYVCPNTTMSQPSPTTAGYYTNTTAAVVGIQCPLGSYCPQQTADPILCSLGHQCPFSGMASPMDCHPGYFCDESGLINQKPCQPGYMCFGYNTIVPDLCYSGYYCPRMKTAFGSQVIECGLFSYCPTGSAAESSCPSGMYCYWGYYHLCPRNTYSTGDEVITDYYYSDDWDGVFQCQPCGRFYHSSTGASKCSLTPLGGFLFIGVPIIGVALIIFLCLLYRYRTRVKQYCCTNKRERDRHGAHAEGQQPDQAPDVYDKEDHPCDLYVHIHLNEPGGVNGADREGVIRSPDPGSAIRSMEGVELVSIRSPNDAAGEVGDAAANLKLSFITPHDLGHAAAGPPGVSHHLNQEAEPGAIEGHSVASSSIIPQPSRPSIVPVYHHSIATPTICMSPTVADETNQIEGEGSPICLGRCIHTGALDLSAIRSRLSCYTFQRLYRTNKLECIDCEFSWNKSSLWICLECNDLIHSSRCDSYHQKHSYQHFKSTSHALAIHAEKQIIWCYVCNKVVLNEIEDRHSESVIKDAINKQPDNDQEEEAEEEEVEEENQVEE